MKKVIDDLLREATLLGIIDEARPRGNPKALARAKRASAQKASKSSAGQEAEKLGLVWKGGNAYGKTADGPTVATNIKGKLVFQGEDEEALKAAEDDEAAAAKSATQDQKSDDSDLDAFGDAAATDDKTKTKKGESKLNSPDVVKGANKIAERKNKLSNKQIEIEKDKKQFMTNMVDAMLQETSVPKGAGKYTMSRDDFDVYKSYLEGNKPEVPNIEVPDEELDAVFDNIKERLGPKGYSAFISKAKGAGAPPPDIKTDLARARAVVRSYISTGGISVISGERIPFYDTQLDHVVSLANGGVDGGDNWQWMEARYNQFKLEFTDEVLLGKIKNELGKSPEEDRLKLLQSEYKNYARNSMVDFFKRSGYSSLTAEDVLGAKGEGGVQLVKAVAETAGISRYKNVPGGDGGGTRTRGTALPMSVLKEKIVKELKLQPKSAKTKVDEEFAGIINELAKQQGEIGTLKTSIKKQKSDKKESVVYNHIQTLLEMANQV